MVSVFYMEPQFGMPRLRQAGAAEETMAVQVIMLVQPPLVEASLLDRLAAAGLRVALAPRLDIPRAPALR